MAAAKPDVKTPAAPKDAVRTKHRIKRMLEEEEATAKMIAEKAAIAKAEVEAAAAVAKAKAAAAEKKVGITSDQVDSVNALFSNPLAPIASAAAEETVAAKPAAEETPELFEQSFGPYKTTEDAIAKRDELISKAGFPMVKQSAIGQKADGYHLAVTFRTRFPASIAQPEFLVDFVPYDLKDQKD